MTIRKFPILPQTIAAKPETINPNANVITFVYQNTSTNNTRIESWIITSTDTSDRTINVWYNTSSTNYLLVTLNIPANSGNSTSVPAVDILANIPNLPKHSDRSRYLYLHGNDILKLSSTTSLTANKKITSFVQAAENL